MNFNFFFQMFHIEVDLAYLHKEMKFIIIHAKIVIQGYHLIPTESVRGDGKKRTTLKQIIRCKKTLMEI